MKKKIALLFLFAGLALPVFCQINFRNELEKANPVPSKSGLPLQEQVKAHQVFLENARQRRDEEQQLMGLLFLGDDFFKIQNFAETGRYLLEAEQLARAAKNPLWLGTAMNRKARLSLILRKEASAIAQYQESARFCGEARDSLCLAENLEQISSLYGGMDSFELAHQHFAEAMPLLEKYAERMRVGTAWSNFALLLAREGKFGEAIPFYEKALKIAREKGDEYRVSSFSGNMADSWRHLRRYDKALETYRQRIEVNQKNGWADHLIYNYAGMAATLVDMGEYRTAYGFLERHHHLKDSLIGEKTQQRIVDFENQLQESNLQKREMELRAAQSSLERRTFFIVLGLLLVVFGAWRWRIQSRLATHEFAQNRQNLTDLTRILLEKNTRLTELETQITDLTRPADRLASLPPSTDDFENDLFNQRILTDADWSAFKSWFEKANPGFRQRLRVAFPNLTDAEERLFLFLKLNLTRKESAAMLGISADSVKKTRNRLRKRLELAETEDLEAFVGAF